MARVLVVGHICLDLIPNMPANSEIEPGKLLEVGDMQMSTGGAVSNVGLVLDRLGTEVELVAKIGNDFLGQAIRERVGKLSTGLIADQSVGTSYTIVLSQPGVDRSFLHYPGANTTLCSADISDAALSRAALMHFGYPPLLPRFFQNNGADLVDLFRRAKALNVLTSLDMSLPDPNSASGAVDWKTLLAEVLPFCDFFLPSIDELRAIFGLQQTADELAERLLDLGAKIVMIKQGADGFLVRSRAAFAHGPNLSAFIPCFEVEVVGTTGTGDATIAGFISGFIDGLSPHETFNRAAAAGACACESADSTSGIPNMEALNLRIGKWCDKVC
ncbi:hypothetical protein BH11ARM1_BH11ARM1_15270 [soil metagenome]